MTGAIIIFIIAAILLGAILGFASVYFQVNENPVIEQVNAILPQTQCGQCTFPGCKPYATAIVNGEADINQCPPGGDSTIKALATLLGVEAKPLNPENGIEEKPTVAFIDEATCIGCTLCIQACPVDAILGAAKQMHTVIASECTGCDLCLPPCPVDCIDMIEVQNSIQNWHWELPQTTSEIA